MADSGFHIPDEHVEHAFSILKGKDAAVARAAYEYAERHLKVVLAHASAKSNATSQGQRDQDALRSEDYLSALESFEDVAAAYFIARDRRDAAIAIIEAWRSIQANERALGKVG
jgi:hypothetical protein